MFMTLIFTIGHSNRELDEFVHLLQHNQIDTVVDVRRYPGSKSFPQFNKETLAKELLTKHIYYKHIEKLGGRRNNIAASQKYNNERWQNKSFRSYANYMLTKSFKEGIEKLLSLTVNSSGSLAIMCSEAVPWRCHRRLISDYLIIVKNIPVYDIIRNNASTRPSLHVVTPFARHSIDENLVTYPKL